MKAWWAVGLVIGVQRCTCTLSPAHLLHPNKTQSRPDLWHCTISRERTVGLLAIKLKQVILLDTSRELLLYKYSSDKLAWPFVDWTIVCLSLQTPDYCLPVKHGDSLNPRYSPFMITFFEIQHSDSGSRRVCSVGQHLIVDKQELGTSFRSHLQLEIFVLSLSALWAMRIIRENFFWE